MLYVLYAPGGRDLQIVEELRRKNITAYCPRQLKAERRRGNWQYVERVIFTGYVFVDISELQPRIWHSIMDNGSSKRFLSEFPPSDEEDYIRRLCNDGNCIGISRGYVQNEILHITGGFLKDFDYNIVKFNRRGKRATADVTIYGEKHRVVFSVEFDAPPVNA